MCGREEFSNQLTNHGITGETKMIAQDKTKTMCKAVEFLQHRVEIEAVNTDTQEITVRDYYVDSAGEVHFMLVTLTNLSIKSLCEWMGY